MTRFTKFTTGLTAVLALSLISAGAVSADHGRGYQGVQGYRGHGGPPRDRVDVDIRSLQATYTPRGFSSGIEVSYRVSVEDAHRGQSFNLQLSVIDCGRVIQTMVVPLNRGVSRGCEEIEFRGCVTIPACHGYGRSSGRMYVEGSVVESCSGRLLETEQSPVRICGPDPRRCEVRSFDGRSAGFGARGYNGRDHGSWGR